MGAQHNCPLVAKLLGMMPALFHILVLPWRKWCATRLTTLNNVFTGRLAQKVNVQSCWPHFNVLWMPMEQEWHQRITLLTSLGLRHSPPSGHAIHDKMVAPPQRRGSAKSGEGRLSRRVRPLAKKSPGHTCRPSCPTAADDGRYLFLFALLIHMHPCTRAQLSDTFHGWEVRASAQKIARRVILAHMCVKLQMRLYVCHRVGPFWESILGVHFGSLSGDAS